MKWLMGLGFGGGFIALVVAVLLSIGWVLNLVALAKCDFEPKYKAETIRAVGVVVPFVGGVAGWLDIEDINPDNPFNDQD